MRERLAWSRAGKSDDVIDAAVMARWMCFMFVAGALIAATTLGVHILEHGAMPHAGAALVAIVGAAVLAGCLLIAGFDRLPWWAFHTASFWGIVLVAVAVRFGGPVGAALGPLYLWIALFAFNFYRRLHAIGYTLLAGLCYSLTFVGHGRPAPDADEQLIVLLAAIAVAGLMTDRLRRRRERLMGRLADLGRTDPLTGLLNEHAFEQALDAEVQRSIRTGAPATMLMVDVDGLRGLNGRHGDATGDRVIQTVGRALRDAGRAFDVVARRSGGRFGVLLPEIDKHQALIVAERLRARAAEACAACGWQVTLSVGIASHPQDGGDFAEVILAAARAVAAAKKLGRDRAVVHSDRVDDVLATEQDVQAHLATVLALAEALDLRDRSTSAHSRTVGEYAERMAQTLGLDPARVERVRLAGLLHDIGKIAVADAILHKPGKLTDAEWEEMRRHPETGARLLGHAQLEDVRAWVLAHHERPDGRGYPHGLTGEQIPLEARILSVADAYEAMTADRVYRAALTPEAARAELERCAGTQFDAGVVQAFLRTLDGERARASV